MTFVDGEDGFITSHYCTSVSCHSSDLGFDQQVWVERCVSVCVCVFQCMAEILSKASQGSV